MDVLEPTVDFKTANALRNAFGHFYDQGETTAFKDTETGLRLKNSTELIDELWKIGIPKNMSIKHIGITLERWYETLSKAPEYTEPTMTGAPESSVQSNIPQKGLREVQEIERQSREAGIRAAKEKGERETHELIERLKARKITVVPKEEIPVVNLSSNDKKKLYDLGVAAKTDPGTAQKIIEEKIQESLDKSPEEIKKAVPEEVVTKAAVDLVDKIKPFGDYKTAEEIPSKFASMNPVSPVAAMAILNDAKLKGLITDDQIRAIIAENAQNIALAMEAERNINTSLTEPLLYGSPNVTSVLYGPDQITQFQIAEDQDREDGVDLDISELIDRGRDIRDVWGKLAAKKTTVSEAAEATSTFVTSYSPSINVAVVTKSSSLLIKALPTVGGITGFKTGILAQQWLMQGTPRLMSPQVAGWLGSGGPQQAVGASVFTRTYSLQSVSGKYGVALATGKNVYGANTLMAGVKIGGSKIAVAASATGTKVAASGVFARVGAFIGSAGPVVGTIIGAAAGWIVGKVVEKIPWDKVKKALPYIVGLITLPFFGPIAGLMTGLGTAALMGIGAGVLGAKASVGAFGVGIGNFFRILGKAAMVTVGTPFLITLLVFPVVVALVLFIINSGAYVVPPSPSSLNLGGFSSPYVDLKKTANPPGTFSNSDFPKEITYTVTIKPKKGDLNNVQLSYDCQVISRANLVCPTIELEDKYKDIFSKPIDSVSAAGLTFTYTSTYNNQFKDSAIIDSIKLNAVVAADNNQASTEVSASVQFGTPPISCPVLGGHTVSPQYNFSLNQANNTGHGSQAYWQAMGQSPSSYALPQSTGCHSTSDCSYYGYAYDIFPPGSRDVYAPTVLGKDVTWSCSYGFVNRASGHTYICTGGGYTLVLTHMAQGAKTGTIKSGEKIGTLYNQIGNTHLHIEFQINGRYVKPENYFCGGK